MTPSEVKKNAPLACMTENFTDSSTCPWLATNARGILANMVAARSPEEKKNKIVPDEVELLSPGEVVKPLPKDPLLQEFIRGQQDRITPPAEFYDPLEKARKSLEDDDNLASETLAAIYAAQGNVQRAIKIYQKLSLRYPEKSRYFAAQIEKLRKRL